LDGSGKAVVDLELPRFRCASGLSGEVMSEGTAIGGVRAAHQFDEARLADYLRAELPEAGGGLRLEQFTYGQSNPTFIVHLENADYVLRKRPPGELLPSAHAVDREYRVQKALVETPVPVPVPILYCADRDVIGTEFYLMERMIGRVYTDSALPGVPAAERRAMYASVAETLAALHTVDIDAVGLSDFGRPGNYFERQFKRWSRNFLETKTREIPDLDRLMAWLPEHMPEGDEAAVVHGDYRIGNLMFHPSEPRVIAVFDWELATLGHPLSDLAYLCILFHTTPDEYWGVRGLDPTETGIPSEADFVATYCRAAGRSDGVTPTHVAHALFRFSAILDGVRARGLAGNAAADNAEEIGRLALAMARRGRELIDA
jgi:aminoglycoside phosphotransferase (APT) family kinase protein